MSHIKILSILLMVAGAVIATLLVGWFGFGRVATAILSVGGRGFAYYCAWQLLLFVLLGGAWWTIAPRGPWRIAAFVWGRMVRDSAAACLPFSQIGGYLFGVRAVSLFGVPTSTAAISSGVDLVAEFVAQLVFLLVGIIILLARRSESALVIASAAGIGAALIVVVVVSRLQARAAALFARAGRRILGGRIFSPAPGEAAISDAELARLYGHSGRIAAGTMLHLIGWCGKGAGNWIAFWMLGAPVSMADALAIEALLYALLAVAFVVPGYAGVQEAGYTGLGAVFGITPEISLAVSLLRRARDLAIGIPILLIWQLMEVRKLAGGAPRQ